MCRCVCTCVKESTATTTESEKSAASRGPDTVAVPRVSVAFAPVAVARTARPTTLAAAVLPFRRIPGFAALQALTPSMGIGSRRDGFGGGRLFGAGPVALSGPPGASVHSMGAVPVGAPVATLDGEPVLLSRSAQRDRAPRPAFDSAAAGASGAVYPVAMRPHPEYGVLG